jgi:tight adherence protein C
VPAVLIGLLVFATAFIGILALTARTADRERIAARLREIEEQRSSRAATLRLPFHRRVLLPLGRAGVQAVTGVLPPWSISAVRANLVRAGQRRTDPGGWIARKWLLTGVAALIGYVGGRVSHGAPVVQLAAAAVCGAGAYLVVELSLRRKIRARQARILKEFPETLDLLTVSVEAGLGLDQAFSVIVRRRTGPLTEEVWQYLGEVKLGRDRREALMNIGERTGVEELVSFSAMLVQSIEFGTSVANILRAQADDARTRRRQRVEERAMKAPVKLLFPLIFLIMPAIFVVLAGPGLIRVYTELLTPGSSQTIGAPAAPSR